MGRALANDAQRLVEFRGGFLGFALLVGLDLDGQVEAETQETLFPRPQIGHAAAVRFSVIAPLDHPSVSRQTRIRPDSQGTPRPMCKS